MKLREEDIRTPKIQAFAFIVDCDEIFLLRQKDGRFTLPGGWVSPDNSIRRFLIKSVWEQTGMDVDPVRCICLHDRNDHHIPKYDFEACQVFMLCEIERGCFGPNKAPWMEMDFYKIGKLPPLVEEDVTRSQLEICLTGYHIHNFHTIVD